jgi:AcrR family transcriptional regulator
MLQVERSERSRTAILDAALDLFSHRGYGATSMRDIAAKAGVSTGSVYHHFQDKEAIFQALLEQFQAITKRPDFPINVAINRGGVTDFEGLAGAAHDVLAQWRRHLALFYVDAVEFDGRHIQRFYADLADRYAQFVETNRGRLGLDTHFRDDVPPAAALLFATRVFIYYFSVEMLFGVERQLGLASGDATRMISSILRQGMLRAAPDAP